MLTMENHAIREVGRMKNKGKRFLSLFLALLMLVGLTMPTQILSPRVKAAAGQVPASTQRTTVTVRRNSN